jgi:hypothetical protein
VYEKKDGGISLFMQKLSTAYTMYFNKKNERSGSLFAGRFKASYAHSDVYLKYLFSYIHLNPAKIVEPRWRETGLLNEKKTIDFVRNYPYSTYKDYLKNNRVEGIVLNKQAFPDYFSEAGSFEKDVLSWFTTEVEP